MSYRGLIFRHRRPNDRALARPFGYYSPRHAPFHPIYEVNELAFASHCPRKALFLFRRGLNTSWNINYQRPSTQQSRESFQNGSWYIHSNSFIRTIIEILSHLGGMYNNLQNFQVEDPEWRRTINSIVENDNEIEKCYSTLLNDIISFFNRWNSENRLSSYFQHPEDIVFNYEVFNPEVELNNEKPVNPDRGIFVDSFPLIGQAHIINFHTSLIIFYSLLPNYIFLQLIFYPFCLIPLLL